MTNPPDNPPRLSSLPDSEDSLGVGRMFREASELPDEEVPRLRWRLRTSQRLRVMRPRLVARVALVVGMAFCTGGVVGAVVSPLLARRKSAVVVAPTPAIAPTAATPEGANGERFAEPRRACRTQSPASSAPAVRRRGTEVSSRRGPAGRRARETSEWGDHRRHDRDRTARRRAAARRAAARRAAARRFAACRVVAHRRRAGAAGASDQDVARRTRCWDRAGLARAIRGPIPRRSLRLRGNGAAHRGPARPRETGTKRSCSWTGSRSHRCPTRTSNGSCGASCAPPTGAGEKRQQDFDDALRGRDLPTTNPRARSLQERALWGRAAARSRLGDQAGARADLELYLRDFPAGRFSAAAASLLRGAP